MAVGVFSCRAIAQQTHGRQRTMRYAPVHKDRFPRRRPDSADALWLAGSEFLLFPAIPSAEEELGNHFPNGILLTFAIALLYSGNRLPHLGRISEVQARRNRQAGADPVQ